MKNLQILACTFLLLYGCSSGKNHTVSESSVLAILPIETSIKQSDNANLDINTIEQSEDIQSAISNYILNKGVKIRLQSTRTTNSILQKNGVDLSRLSEYDPVEMASLLNVDYILFGDMVLERPMSEEVATGINMAKKLERNLLGTYYGNAIKTTTNRGACNLSLLETTTGSSIWSFREKIDAGQGSSIQDIINKLMKKGAKKFPF